ncbi:MAG TPA: hypothetical protein VNZ86_08345 [Bacteroidia bacterium]|jgi:hypothetical protein|nr:hypothetical protein [Bacteroidia bacterium]
MNVSNAERDKIRARIQMLLGGVEYPHGIMAMEISYIAGLSGSYQDLAIYQAALGQLIAKGADPILQDLLKKQIQEMAAKLQQEEVEAVNANKAWADKYGDLHYVQKNGKVKAVWEEDKPVPLPEPECKLCVDGKISSTLSKHSGAWYPCECPLGDKWAKNTGYMGPPVGQVTKAGAQQTVGKYYGKKFVEDLKKNTQNFAVSTTTTTQNIAAYEQYTGTFTVPIEAAINEVKMKWKDAPTQTTWKPEVLVKEVEEPTGRKFKEKL